MPVERDDQTETTLAEFCHDYVTQRKAEQDRWKHWVHANFNLNEFDLAKGRYALQLMLRWDVVKITAYGTAPLLLSLAVGLWYKPRSFEPDVDQNAIIQTAWTIAAYVVSAAGVAIALLAAITQLGDV